uniref:Uncharacterized protein n=1 Tax=Glossina austeni TaxID=7395 RepID=A0A1A9UQ69_GLOAU
MAVNYVVTCFLISLTVSYGTDGNHCDDEIFVHNKRLRMMRIMFYLPAMLKDQQKQFEELADKYDIKLNKNIDDIKTESLEDLLETLKKDDEDETEELSEFEKAK